MTRAGLPRDITLLLLPSHLWSRTSSLLLCLSFHLLYGDPCHHPPWAFFAVPHSFTQACGFMIPGSNQGNIFKWTKKNLILFWELQLLVYFATHELFTAHVTGHTSSHFAAPEGKHFKVDFRGLCIENVIRAPDHKTASLISIKH